MSSPSSAVDFLGVVDDVSETVAIDIDVIGWVNVDMNVDRVCGDDADDDADAVAAATLART